MDRNLLVHRGRALLALAVAAFALSLVMGTSSAHAGLGIACPDPTAQVFRPWSDFAQYAQVPDGGFEAGASGWTLTGGAKVVPGNEPFFLNSKSDRYSLLLSAGGTATSPPMCIALLSSKMRFLIGGQAKSTVKVQIIYRGLLSKVLGILDGGTIASDGTWQPSPQISMLGGVLPVLTRSVQFRLVATSGTIQVDDLYLDPWKIT